MLKGASAMHFDLLHEILDVPLHGVSVSFNGVEYNTMSSTTCFEASSMLEFGCAVSSYGLRVIRERESKTDRERERERERETHLPQIFLPRSSVLGVFLARFLPT